MAEGLLRRMAPDRFEVESAGVEPSHVRPQAVEAMREIGIDISGHRSKSVGEFTGQEFDYVITVCDHARELCPVFPGRTKHLHWSFPDPASGPMTSQSNSMRMAARCCLTVGLERSFCS